MDFGPALYYEQKRFIEKMHPYFGLAKTPEEVDMRDSGKLPSGFDYYKETGEPFMTIRTDEVYNGSILDSCCHESTHYLHFLANSKVKELTLLNAKMASLGRSRSDLSVPIVRLIEFVAYFATIKFRSMQFKSRKLSFASFVERSIHIGAPI